jgi:hypothetical protein
MWREDDTLVIQTGFGWDGGDRRFDRRGWRGRQLSVRMNPNLPLDVDLAGGTITLSGVRAPVRASFSAGNARLDGITSPVDVLVTAGNVRVSGRFTEGESHIRCEAGNAHVHIEQGSDVVVRARAGMGRVNLPSGGGRWGLNPGTHEWVAGAGRGRLDLDVSYGNANVTAG